MPEVQLFTKTVNFSNKVGMSVQLYGNPNCRFHVKIDSGPRGTDFNMYLVVGANAFSGTRAKDGLTGGNASKQVLNDNKQYDFTWSVPAGTYTLVLEHPYDSNKPNAKVKDATITVLCDPGGKLLGNVPQAGVPNATPDPHPQTTNPNNPAPGFVHGPGGSGSGGSSGDPGTGGSGSGSLGTGTGGQGGGSLPGQLGPENPSGSGTGSTDPTGTPGEQGGPPVDKVGNPDGGSSSGGGPTPDEPGGSSAPGGPGGGSPTPGDPGGEGPAPSTAGGGPTPTEPGGGGPPPGDPGGGGPAPGDSGGGGPAPGGGGASPGGGGPPPADPGGGGPPPADPGGGGPPPADPGGGGGDPPPPPPAFPADWVMSISAVLGASQSAQVGAILSGTQAHSAPEAALAVGVTLGAAVSEVLAGLGIAGVSAAHVEAHVGPLHGHDHAPSGGGVAHFAFLYVPHGAPVRSIRFREPRSGAVQVVQIHPNGLLVFRSELVAETIGERHAPMVHGRLLARRA